MSTLITDAHLSKPAYIYVRQSTLAQVRHNQESTEPWRSRKLTHFRS